MIKNFLAVAVLVGGLAACAEAPAPTAIDNDAIALNKTNWNGVNLDAGAAYISEDRAYVSVDFRFTGLGNNRSADIVATANNLEIDIECVKTYRNGREDRTRTRTYRNWRGTGRFAVDRNGHLVGTLDLDRNNSDKQLFCSGQGSGWNYTGSSIVQRGTIGVGLGDRRWTIN